MANSRASLSEQVSDVHLQDISRSCCSKWRRLPARLEMEEIVVQDIDRLQGLSEEEKRLNFFKQWKSEKGSEATYKKLIDALVKIKCREDAEKVQCLIENPATTTATMSSSIT